MLLEQTGYTFGSDQRLGIYLTNTLEEAAQKSDMLLGQFVSREANAAAEIKRDRPIMVVLGNPPYSGHSANKGQWIIDLVRDYYQVDGQPLGERNPKWLQADEVKFIRFAEWRINETGEGVLGYITSHGYLDNPTFRGMRQHLMKTFDELYVLDLHGNSKKKEKTPDGGKDENVFDIQQGVAILLAVKLKKVDAASRRVGSGGDAASTKNAKVFHADLWGRREIYEGEQLVGGKYQWLWQNNAETTSWQELSPTSPSYLFCPQDTALRPEYEAYWKVTELLPLNVLGFQTHRDHFAIDFDEADLRRRIGELRDKRLSDDDIRAKYQVSDNSDWKLAEVRPTLRNAPRWEDAFAQCLYRPFDFRPCYFSQAAMDRPRRELVNHVLHRENLCLLVPRQIGFPPWQHAGVSRFVTESCLVSTKTKEQNYCFPLYLYPAADQLDVMSGRRPNLSPAFLKALAEKLDLPQVKPHGLPNGVTPEGIFHYAYAVFHSPTYRTRYAGFLKIDFPRLPLTGNRDLFFTLAALGQELTALHIMESPKLNDLITEFPAKGTDTVEKVAYVSDPSQKGGPSAPQAGMGRVYINPVQYFGNVPSAVWNFHIGGYQVCEKWLKDRKTRTLTYEDIQHYQKIVVALSETIRLMEEVDQVIATAGGWPIK
jgi:predicted helicase